jgi:hypothetical protein
MPVRDRLDPKPRIAHLWPPLTTESAVRRGQAVAGAGPRRTDHLPPAQSRRSEPLGPLMSFAGSQRRACVRGLLRPDRAAKRWLHAADPTSNQDGKARQRPSGWGRTDITDEQQKGHAVVGTRGPASAWPARTMTTKSVNLAFPIVWFQAPAQPSLVRPLRAPRPERPKSHPYLRASLRRLGRLRPKAEVSTS